jgi:hypothetical protein
VDGWGAAYVCVWFSGSRGSRGARLALGLGAKKASEQGTLGSAGQELTGAAICSGKRNVTLLQAALGRREGKGKKATKAYGVIVQS